ncbi:inactive protein restricted tev movement 1, partial [Nicotiana attenuata]
MNMIKFGPVGGNKGTVWDEKGKGQIAKIFISDDGPTVCSLQFLFVDNGVFALSELHGTVGPSKNFSAVVLDYPSEYLIWVKCASNEGFLKSITFGTNKSSYGPYGSNIPPCYTKFSFQIGEDRSFGGFHGTKYLNWIESIGIYVKTVTSSRIVA